MAMSSMMLWLHVAVAAIAFVFMIADFYVADKGSSHEKTLVVFNGLFFLAIFLSLVVWLVYTQWWSKMSTSNPSIEKKYPSLSSMTATMAK